MAHGLRPAVSVGLHSGEGGIGWVISAAARCSELCHATEGGQIFISQETAKLLQDEDLGELSIRDLGEQQTRRTQRAVRADERADAVLHRSSCSCQLGGGPGRGARSSARRPSRMRAR
jgi:class 3 adenylate cyclase